MQIINIRPTTSVYATYQRLSYTPWYAIAEFVDNSTQSYFDNRTKLLRAYEAEDCEGLWVDINYDFAQNCLVVLDNAYGMEIEDFTRALVLDSPPKNRGGRSEFGMGLKTAACWFGARWSVESTRLGSPRKYAATIDVPGLAASRSETIEVRETQVNPESHFTKVTIEQLRHPIKGRTLGRVRDQLGSMYRQDIRSQEIRLTWCGMPVTFEDPPILCEAEKGGGTKEWKKDIHFAVPVGAGEAELDVFGWVGIRNPARQRDAGFVLMRRNRVIVGGPGEGYKPEEIFGQGNTFRSQRLIGELNMDFWPVTQAKDAFDWSDGLEDAFIEALKGECREYADYAERYRATVVPERVSFGQMAIAAEAVKQLVERPSFAEAVTEAIAEASGGVSASEEPPLPKEVRSQSEGPIAYTLDLNNARWEFRLHWQDQYPDAQWMYLELAAPTSIDIYLNLSHPFFSPYLEQPGMLELLQKLVISLALAEQMARTASSDSRIWPADFRIHMNTVLRRIGDMEGPST